MYEKKNYQGEKVHRKLGLSWSKGHKKVICTDKVSSFQTDNHNITCSHLISAYMTWCGKTQTCFTDGSAQYSSTNMNNCSPTTLLQSFPVLTTSPGDRISSDTLDYLFCLDRDITININLHGFLSS